MNSDLIVLILFCLILINTKLIFRNKWVCKTRIKWNNQVSLYRQYILNHHYDVYCSMDKLYTYEDMYNIISSYNKMFFIFWQNDLKKFVKPENIKLFEEINSVEEKNGFVLLKNKEK